MSADPGLLAPPGVTAALGHEKVGHTGQGLWHHKGMQLPAYVQHIANDLIGERGMTESRAIATAVSRCKAWCAGGDNVSPDTRAKACAAVAEWEALKGEARTASAPAYDLPGDDEGFLAAAGEPFIAAVWNETLHPRQGGKFAPKGQGGKGKLPPAWEGHGIIWRLKGELATLEEQRRRANARKPGSWEGDGRIAEVRARLERTLALRRQVNERRRAALARRRRPAAPRAAQGEVDGGGPLATLPDVDLVAAGTWNLSSGATTFTPEDFRAAIDAAACPAVGPPLIKLGHVDPRFDGEPAVGKVSNLRLAAGGTVLKGDLTGLPGWMPGLMASAYPRRSIEGAYDFRCQIGHRHPFVLTALALLGVTPPGVGVLGGLDDVKALYEARAAARAGQTWTLDLEAIPMTAPHAARGSAKITDEDVRTAYYEAAGSGNYSLWIAETHLDADPPSLIVADSDSRKTYRVPVTIASGQVSFGDPVEVRPAYVDASAISDWDEGQVTEADWWSAEPDVTAAWDAGAAVKAMGDDPSATAIRAMFAIPGATKSDSRLPHHNCSDGQVGAANPDACSQAIGALNGARTPMAGVSASARNAAYGHLAAHLRDAGREPPPLKAAADEHPFTGKHTHAHPALGTQGGDETHEHEHSHQGDADHAHDHPARASTEGATEVDFTDDQERRIRLALGLADDAEFDPEAVTAAAEETGKRADGKIHASYRPPEGAIVVAKEAWDGLQARVRQGELAREAQLRGERDQVLSAAIREGRFSAASRAHWERMWQADPDGTRAAIGTLQRNAVPIEDIGRAGGGPDDLLDDEYRLLFPPVPGS